MKLLTFIIFFVTFIYYGSLLEAKKSHKLRRGLLRSKAVEQAEEMAVDKTGQKSRNLRRIRLASNAVRQAEQTVVDKTGEKSKNLRRLRLESNAFRQAEETTVDKTGEKSKNLTLKLASNADEQAEETAVDKVGEKSRNLSLRLAAKSCIGPERWQKYNCDSRTKRWFGCSRSYHICWKYNCNRGNIVINGGRARLPVTHCFTYDSCFYHYDCLVATSHDCRPWFGLD